MCTTGRAARASRPAWTNSTTAGAAPARRQRRPMLVSDGLDRRRAWRAVRSAAQLRRLAHQIVWLNLLRYEGFEARAAGDARCCRMSTALPVHNLASLDRPGTRCVAEATQSRGGGWPPNRGGRIRGVEHGRLDLPGPAAGHDWHAGGHKVWLVTVIETWGSRPRGRPASCSPAGDGLVVGRCPAAVSRTT